MSIDLNIKTLHYPYKLSLFYERLRKLLIINGLYKIALKTYFLQKVSFDDKNSPKFWDELFMSNKNIDPIANWRHDVVLKKINPNKNILNIGVGRGDFEDLLFKWFPNIQYVGTDITVNTLNYVKSKFDGKKFIKSSVYNLPFNSDTFDQICLLEVIEHIKPQKTMIVLKEIARVLNKEGILVISIPVNESLHETLPNNPNSHMRSYSLNLLKFEILVTGLRPIKIYEASAFKKLFFIKNVINHILKIKKPNYYIILAKKI